MGYTFAFFLGDLSLLTFSQLPSLAFCLTVLAVACLLLIITIIINQIASQRFHTPAGSSILRILNFLPAAYGLLIAFSLGLLWANAQATWQQQCVLPVALENKSLLITGVVAS